MGMAGRGAVEIILLAAGASRRMGGRDKLLESAGGEALIRRVARAALASDAGQVHVVVPAGCSGRRAALDGLGVRVVENPGAAEGMAASIRVGVCAVSGQAGAVIVALADMPDLTGRDYNALIRAWAETGRICRAATAEGVPGHPVLFPRRFFGGLARLSGDRGARAVLTRAADEVRLVRLPGQRAGTDLDTPQDWQRWRGG